VLIIHTQEANRNMLLPDALGSLKYYNLSDRNDGLESALPRSIDTLIHDFRVVILAAS
jgi:hypothetical protein